MPILDPLALEFISRNVEQTRRVGMRLGGLLRPGDLVCLVGDLGTGKTTFVQGVAAGWGSLDQVSSPTFVLVNVYSRPAGGKLFHMDAYRLSGAPEAEDLDLDTLLESGILFVEWADRILETLPREYLQIDLRWISDQQRDLVLRARGERYTQLLAALRKRIYGGL